MMAEWPLAVRSGHASTCGFAELGVDEREWQSRKTLRRRSNCGHIHFN